MIKAAPCVGEEKPQPFCELQERTRLLSVTRRQSTFTREKRQGFFMSRSARCGTASACPSPVTMPVQQNLPWNHETVERARTHSDCPRPCPEPTVLCTVENLGPHLFKINLGPRRANRRDPEGLHATFAS